jgi:hypothetical protein
LQSFIPSYTFETLLWRNWPLSLHNRLTLRISLIYIGFYINFNSKFIPASYQTEISLGPNTRTRQICSTNRYLMTTTETYLVHPGVQLTVGWVIITLHADHVEMCKWPL